MKPDSKGRKKALTLDYLLLLIFVIITIATVYFFPAKGTEIVKTSKKYLIEMVFILPAVMILIGLFSVWVPTQTVVNHLGEGSGLKGALLSILFGSLPTGPLYIAFPMASALLKKGARVSNIVIFLSAWACIKIPQEMVELQFLGWKFTLLRLSLTIVSVIVMGLVIEKIVGWQEESKI